MVRSGLGANLGQRAHRDNPEFPHRRRAMPGWCWAVANGEHVGYSYVSISQQGYLDLGAE